MTSELLEKLYMVQNIDRVKENPKQPDDTEAKVFIPFNIFQTRYSLQMFGLA